MVFPGPDGLSLYLHVYLSSLKPEEVDSSFRTAGMKIPGVSRLCLRRADEVCVQTNEISRLPLGEDYPRAPCRCASRWRGRMVVVCATAGRAR